MTDKDDFLLYVSILFGVIATLVAGIPLALENHSVDTKNSIGIGLIIVGYIFFTYFIYVIKLGGYRNTIKDKNTASKELGKNVAYYVALGIVTRFIIYVAVPVSYIPNRDYAWLIGVAVYSPLFIMSHFAITKASRDQGIFVGEWEAIHAIAIFFEEKLNVKNFGDVIGKSLIHLYVTMVISLVLLAGILVPLGIFEVPTTQTNMNSIVTVFILMIIVLLLSYYAAIRNGIKRWKTINGGINNLPDSIEAIKIIIIPSSIFLLSVIVLAILLSAGVSYLKIPDSSSNFIAELIALLIAISLPYLLTSHLAIKNWIHIDTIRNQHP